MNRKNPNLWSALSVFVAVVALILTQFPPIRQMVRGTDIRISTPQQIEIWHNLGNIGVSIFLDIHNAGGYTINVNKIECAILENDTGKVHFLPVRSYLVEDRYLWLGTITIDPDQHWTHDVSCNAPFPRSELEQVTELIAEIRADIVDNQDRLPNEDKTNIPVVISDTLYQEAVDFFNKKYDLTNEGNYQFFVRAVSESGETLKVIGFDFTLFKSNIQTLQKVAEKDYKYGGGIADEFRYTLGPVSIPVSPMDEKEAERIYQQRIANP